jgi:DNA repair exonuclease SbcCD nuclease subunit
MSNRQQILPARVLRRRARLLPWRAMKFIHAADLHLDSPLVGLARYEGAPAEELRGATRKALGNLVSLAIEERVQFVLIAGDVYDGDWRDYNTGLYFATQMSRLRQANIPVYLIRGNHDAGSQISRQLRLPDNVQELPTSAPRTIRLDELRVAIHGRGFATAAVTEDLSAGYPCPIPGWFNIGMLHTSAGGRPGHENYAPCAAADLVRKGYDYWALGHVHQREVLHEDPWIVFPGNVQGRHIREPGAKGCSLVEVVDGRVARVTHRPVDIVRWAECAVDAAGAHDEAELLERLAAALRAAASAADGRFLAARVVFSGATTAHALLERRADQFIADCRALANDRFNGKVWLEKIQFQTRMPFDPAGIEAESDPLAELWRFLQELRGDAGRLQELAADLAELKRKLPSELRAGSDALALEDPAWVARELEEAAQILLPRLDAARGAR